MDIVGAFKEGVDVAKKNYILLVPNIAAMVVMFILTLMVVAGGAMSMGLMGGMRSPGAMMTGAGSLMGGFFIVMLIGFILGLFAHAMTVAMAREAIDTGSTSFQTGISTATSRLGAILVAAVIVGIIVAIGSMLFVIPGIVAAFFLMFTFTAIVIDNAGAVDAIKKSFATVKAHLNDTVVFFLILIVLGFAAGVVNALLNFIPLLGQLLGMALMGAFGGYVSIVMVKVYRSLGQASQ